MSGRNGTSVLIQLEHAAGASAALCLVFEIPASMLEVVWLLIHL